MRPCRYATSLALHTDLYQFTMAHGYWHRGIADREAVFHLFFCRAPFRGDHAAAAGLDTALGLLERLRFAADDLAWLATVPGADGAPLFPSAFLDWLGEQQMTLGVDAVPEGTVVYPHEPLLRVRGPLAFAQLVETTLLNIINFQTLIATKAARICEAAGDDPVLEFGMRRAQGIDGAISASRAAFLGGCAATSNVLAGRLFGIPLRGTHTHSWVTAFPTERDAFAAYAEVMPNDCVFLVDTYDTLDGVRQAVQIGLELRARGHELVGVRLDSGDLGELAHGARRILDEGGSPQAHIVASNDLDEHAITGLKGSPIQVWGVGTRLVTGYDQPALGGVYKLAALRETDGTWSHRLKLSEDLIKTSIPGIQPVRRHHDGDTGLADALVDELTPTSEPIRWVDPVDPRRRGVLPSSTPYTDLLHPVLRGGVPVTGPPPLMVSRDHAAPIRLAWKRACPPPARG